MVSPNWENESYAPSPYEQCCRCGEPLGEAGAHYWGRVRVCQRCYNEELDWHSEEHLQDFRDFETVMRTLGWAVICVAGAAIAGCVVRLFI